MTDEHTGLPPWRHALGFLIQGAALAVLIAKAVHIPWAWVGRPFGSFMGKEADFVGSLFLTFLAALASGLLLCSYRYICKRWGKVTIVWMVILLVHLVQDAVLGWAYYFP